MILKVCVQKKGRVFEQVGGPWLPGFHRVKELRPLVSRHGRRAWATLRLWHLHAAVSPEGKVQPRGQGSHAPAKRREGGLLSPGSIPLVWEAAILWPALPAACQLGRLPARPPHRGALA